MVSKKVIIILAVVVLACLGVLAGVVISNSDSILNGSSEGSGLASGSGSGTSGSSTGGGSSKKPSDSAGSKVSTEDKEVKGEVKSDPTEASFDFSAFAIGDWGQTMYYTNGSSCCSRRKDGSYTALDRHAEQAVSHLMALTADELKPEVVIGHGDSFYWTGIMGEMDQKHRFQEVFEDRYSQDSLIDVPWVNVMGNHDYGGGSYICMEDEELAECSGSSAVTSAMQKKLDLQSSYTSPNNDRWILKDHYYVYSIEQGDVSVDIFNLDTNDADSHGASQICCQCYSYSSGEEDEDGEEIKCNEVTRGNKYCAGGDNDMYDACMKQFKEWGDESRKKLLEDVKESKATWKIVNSHYSPYNHYGTAMSDEWKELLGNAKGLQLWMNGHTHGEKHDYSEKVRTHFIENGAGGGIQSESSSGIPAYAKDWMEHLWRATGRGDSNPYGFFELQFSKEWMKVRFRTFDDSWALTKEDDGYSKGTVGGVQTGHCWYIPADGGEGKECSD